MRAARASSPRCGRGGGGSCRASELAAWPARRRRRSAWRGTGRRSARPRVRMTTPWCRAGRKPLRPVDRAAGGQLAGVGQHDERGQVVGLAAQAVATARSPALGKPLRRKPVFSWNVAGVWFAVSATIERMTVSSSATPARCGKRSETHSPLCPAGGSPSRACAAGRPGRRRRRACSSTGERLAVRGDQLGLVVERVDLAHRRRTRQMWMARVRLGREVRAARPGRRRARSRRAVPSRSSNEAAAAPAEPVPASRRRSRARSTGASPRSARMPAISRR